MKNIFSLLAILASLAAQAQTAPTQPTTPPAPTQPVTPQRPMQPPPNVPPQQTTPPRVVIPPNANQRLVIGATSNAAAMGATAFSNRFNLTNPQATVGAEGNGSLVAAERVLADLQGDIEQALPILFALTTKANVNTPQTTAAGSAGTVQSSTAPGSQPQLLPPTGNPNPRLPAQGQLFVGTVGTNFVAMNVETLRLLAILRNDLQQTLPVLQALNGAQAANVNPASSGSFTGFANRFTFITNSFPGAPNQPGTLAPTGR